MTQRSTHSGLFQGEGEVRALLRRHDWSMSMLGHPDTWPQELLAAVKLLLNSKFPMFVAWGPSLGFIYNDEYAVIMGEKHPAALGCPFQEVWSEIWTDIGPIVALALAGEPSYFEDLPLAVRRNGFAEQAWFTFSYSPLEDSQGVVGGMYCTVVETTGRVVSERRQAFALSLADRLRDVSAPHDIVAATSEMLGRHLAVSGVFYAEVNDEKELFQIRRDWTAPGRPSLAGVSRSLDEFGPEIIAMARSGKVIAIEDTLADASTLPYIKAYDQLGARALVSAPLVKSGKLIGTLNLYHGSRRHWSAGDLILVQEVAERTWAALERARAESELQAVREQSHQILQIMNEGFVVMDHEFRVQQINAEALKIDGRAASEILGRSHWDAWPGSEALAIGTAYKRVMEDRIAISLEQCYPRADGDAWFDIRAYPLGNGIALIYRDISARKQTDRALRESETRLQQLANTIPQLAWMAHPDGAVHWYNDRWYGYTGTVSAQMENDGWQSVHHPDVLPSVLALWTSSIACGEPFSMTFPLRGADGRYRPFLTLVSPLHDSSGRVIQWFGTNTDVAPLREAEQALRKSEERLQEGLLAGRMVVWDWNLLDGAVHFSSSASAVFGHAGDHQVAGWEGVHADDLPRLREAADLAVANRGEFRELVRMVRPDNQEIIWVDVRGNVICDTDGHPLNVRGISLDVTERTLATRQLKEADRRKDEFLAMLAHELRNPLAPISSAAQILKMTSGDNERIRRTSDIIARQVKHMSSLVDDLLDVSRVTRGLVRLDKTELDIRQVVASAVEQVRSLIDARRHALRIRMGAENIFVEGDRIRLVQVLANILTNAAKYTSQEGTILLAVEIEQQEVVLSVTDNGIGIRQELLPHVFELFSQGERTPDRSQGGLGLGLALVKSMMELHGGRVHAYSRGTGLGSTFTIALPLSRNTSDAAPEQHDAASTDSSQRLRLMVVDDNVDAAQTLAVLLTAMGHDVAVRHDATSALEPLTESPQAFILDIGLPDIDGYELARRLRSHPGTADAVLIALTGYGQANDRVLSKAAGFDHHFVKPIDNAELMKILAQIR